MHSATSTCVLSGSTSRCGIWQGRSGTCPCLSFWEGTFREEIPLYSHCGHEGNFWSKEEWRARAKELVDYPSGFKAFKVDLNDALGVTARQFVPSSDR